MAVALINLFSVPKGKEEKFVERWQEVNQSEVETSERALG